MARVSFKTKHGRVTFTTHPNRRRPVRRRGRPSLLSPWKFCRGETKRRPKGTVAGGVYRIGGKTYMACRDGLMHRVAKH
jgi:hypothetical protein